MYPNRFGVCLAGGLISALICIVGSQIIRGFPPRTLETMADKVTNRLLLGFVIGISSWRINYLLHGAALGLILSLTVSIGFTDLTDFALYTSAGVLYGLMIEAFSTVTFSSPMRPREVIS